MNEVILEMKNDFKNLLYEIYQKYRLKYNNEGKMSVSATRLSRAFVVIFNYAKMLKYYDSIYNENIKVKFRRKL